MKRISNQEYDDLMAFMKPKLQSLWEHENNEREKQGRDALNMFQFGFSILDINHYLIDDECDFYLVFNGSFLRMIYDTLLNASKEHPEKFGTGDANDVIDALYDVSGFYDVGDKNRYIEFISENACCYIIYRNNKEFDNDILRIDLFRHVMPNKKDNSKLDFVGGLMHTLKHFSIEDQNLSTGKDIYNVFDIHHIVYLIGMAFRLREGEGSKYEAIQKLTNANMFASFYKENVSGVFFLNSYYKKKSVKI